MNKEKVVENVMAEVGQEVKNTSLPENVTEAPQDEEHMDLSQVKEYHNWVQTYLNVSDDEGLLLGDIELEEFVKKTCGELNALNIKKVENPEDLLQQIKSLLNDDGLAMIALPNCASTDAKILQEYWAAYDVPRHLWHFTPDTLKQAAEQNGFELIGKVRLPLDSFYVSMLSAQYRKNTLAPIRGAWIGFRSFWTSSFNVDKSSSILYICKKA